MKQWISGSFGLGVMLPALFALSQWPALAGAGQGDGAAHMKQAVIANAPAHLGWMLEQHWRVVNGQLK